MRVDFKWCQPQHFIETMHIFDDLHWRFSVATYALTNQF